MVCDGSKVFVERITVENFKSIRRLDLDLRPGINLLVGPNASGKTNILEAIYFLYRALAEGPSRLPYMPHAPDYWSPLDLVYNRDPSLNVKYDVALRYMICRGEGPILGSRLGFSIAFAPTPDGSTIAPVRLELDYGGYSRLVLAGGHAELYVENNLFSEYGSFILEQLRETVREVRREEDYTVIEVESAGTTPYTLIRTLKSLPGYGGTSRCREHGGEKVCLDSTLLPPLAKPVTLIYKLEEMSREEFVGFEAPPRHIPPLDTSIIIQVFSRIMLLKHPDTGALREPKPMTETTRLDPRATNLAPVLLSLTGRHGLIPERIQYAVRSLFPNTQLKLEAQFGRVAVKVVEDGLELPPPNIADGLLKLVSIMAAVELMPSILLIDEIENSMHASMLEYVIDELNSLEVPVIITTHSPIVVDLVGPERTLLVTRDHARGTTLERLGDTETLTRRLEELGITLSDYIFYKRTREVRI